MCRASLHVSRCLGLQDRIVSKLRYRRSLIARLCSGLHCVGQQRVPAACRGLAKLPSGGTARSQLHAHPLMRHATDRSVTPCPAFLVLAESWSKPADNTLKVPVSWSAKTPAELLAQKPRICFDLDEGANIYDILMAPGVGIPYAVFDNTRTCCAVSGGRLGTQGRLEAVGSDRAVAEAQVQRAGSLGYVGACASYV